MQDHKIKKIILDQQQFIVAQFQQTKEKIDQKLTKMNEKTAQKFASLKKKITIKFAKLIHEIRTSQSNINVRLKKQNRNIETMNMHFRNYHALIKNERFYRLHQSIYRIFALKRNRKDIKMK
jgi:DNA-binding LytR/AlgR family response regulator